MLWPHQTLGFGHLAGFDHFEHNFVGKSAIALHCTHLLVAVVHNHTWAVAAVGPVVGAAAALEAYMDIGYTEPLQAIL